MMHMYDKLIREGRTGFEHMAEVHNTLSEDLSFRRVIRLAENVEGMALYMMHVSAATGVQAIRESARARLARSTARRCTSTCSTRSDDYQPAERPDLPHLPVAQVAGATRTALWAGTGATATCIAWRPTRCAARSRSRSRASASTTPPAATPASSRAWR